MCCFVCTRRTSGLSRTVCSFYILTTSNTYLTATLGAGSGTVIITTRTCATRTRATIVYRMRRFIISRAYTSTRSICLRYVCPPSTTGLTTTLGTCSCTTSIIRRTLCSCTRTSIVYRMRRLIISRAYTSTCRISCRYICTASTTGLTTTLGTCSCTTSIIRRTLCSCTRTSIVYRMRRSIISCSNTSTRSFCRRYVCPPSTTYLTTTCRGLSCCRVGGISTRTVRFHASTTIGRSSTLTLTSTSC